MSYDKPIISFDGVCGLCNRFIDFVIKRDKKSSFYYSPLQGQAAKNLLGKTDIKTIFLYKEGKVLERSSAVLEVLRIIGGCWKVFFIFRVIPRFLRDWVYCFIANHRYQWFGKREICRIPTAEEKSFFLE